MCSKGLVYLANYVALMRSDGFKEKFNNRQSAAAVNVWYTFSELEYSFPLLCAGIELRHPQGVIGSDGFVLYTQQRKDPVNVDMYCDNKE